MQTCCSSAMAGTRSITHMPGLTAKQPVALVTLRNFRYKQEGASALGCQLRVSVGPSTGPHRRSVVVTYAQQQSSSSKEDSVAPSSSLNANPAEKQPWWAHIAPKVLVAGAIALSLLSPAAARAKTASSASIGPAQIAATGTPTTSWRDTGILLAAAKDEGGSKTTWASPEELDAETSGALSRYADEKMQKQMKRGGQPSKGGKLVRDPLKSKVPDPSTIPPNSEIEKMALQSAWRPDKLKDMTYTQFWNLVGERQVEKARYTADRRSIYVTTKATAPGGARTEKVGLPFDPDLFDHMVEHSVYIETPTPNPALPLVHAVLRLVFPVWFSFLLVKFAFRVGRKKKRDKIFGGARMESISAKDALITFDDIAGIDQVKSEIMEVVAFLKDPQRFLKLGARSPAGVLLVGPPGTGKTLLAKAIAGEAGVPFFSIAGTEFMEMFVGVGASRVRDMFQQARKNAPCILFIDEFDGLGKARQYGGAGNDESVHTINQLLTEMDGFEDNTGVVVMAATNRPAALDQALTRPGRFDRIVHLPLPNVEGRVGILEVHSRDKKVATDLDYQRVARATAGFTGAELMNLMNQAAIIAARQGQPEIGNREIFEALEKVHRDKMGSGGNAATSFENDVVPPRMRRTIAIYEAARSMIGYLTPNFDEIQRVSVCPGGLATGYTYFLPMEERLESRVTTRGYMESRMVVALAGRCAERLILGDANVSTAGASDLELANSVAREMVYRCGFGQRTGPVALMDNEEVYLNRKRTRRVADISTEMAKIAYADVSELLEAAEAKAYWGLAANYDALKALIEKLEVVESLTGEEVGELVESVGVKRFTTPFVEGYTWGPDGSLVWPERTDAPAAAEVGAGVGAGNGNGNGSTAPAWWSKRNPYMVRSDIADMLADPS
jgi:cell division protease FtsH